MIRGKTSDRDSLISDQDRSIIAKKIQTELVKRGLTQAQLSERSCYDERTIRNVLKAVPVRDKTLHDICAVLSIDLLAAPTRHTTSGLDDLDQRASIAVLPFVNMSGDGGHDYFSDGITEDIITELSRFPELLVIARTSTFHYKGRSIDVRTAGRELGARYVLEGSVRRSEQKIRVSAQLIDAETQGHLWAERFDRNLEDVFALQSDLASMIGAVLAAHVIKAESRRAFNKPPENWKAYDFYLRAADAYAGYFRLGKPEPIYAARKLLQQALALDANYARAFAMLSATTISTYASEFDEDHFNPTALTRAHGLAATAVQLDPQLPHGHAELGNVLIWEARPDEAIESFLRAASINPSFADYRYAAALMFAGKPEEAIEAYRTYRRFAPFPNAHAIRNVGHAHYLLKQYEASASLLREAATLGPNDRLTRLNLAATYAQLGSMDAARGEIREVLRIAPSWTIAKVSAILLHRSAADRAHYVDGLRKAGLPEV
jgi:adenylate cyclase